MKDGKVILLEQDKSSSMRGARLLNDRSRAVWRTLQIWLQHSETTDGPLCQRYLFFVNQWVASPIATLLKRAAAKEIEPSAVVNSLRKIGAKRSTSKVQSIIDDVLDRRDESLESLVSKIEIVEPDHPRSSRSSLANGLGLHPRANVDNILNGLFGWLTDKVRTEWSENRPGLITRAEILTQSHALQATQANSRFLPRAAADIVINDTARLGALSRNFVEHLGRIEADAEDIVQAVDHFLKFSTEKQRLVRAGDIPTAEWQNRAHRLRERWANLMRRTKREMAGRPPQQVGQSVLAEATYEHRENLDGHACDELYMTSGHYHRLADEDDVWWDPTFQKGNNGEG